ncbi:hypothetical protein PGAG_00348 [Phaeocystis globosa virus 12T]|uniref:Uncharacterized protein n=1 Tax=Phaeocystis globosa virus PgV-16T TaxID=3071227 RepID=A0AC59EXH4_9VIRU|nr:hypothetical protein PGCG_00393 [Phaeocystis globosa virus]AET73237.1 hypothetical protein PGAG_00348 [Phaeocystis globosa virus 12T]AET73695.1 hypothetical protein PGBG_00384 [Phaeocystis globosa virus 14T]AGM15697.1 hypothetical protein PGCG_00393 [Phaeocystis globosa virus PgV-16T]UYE94427.1 hypothetical protein PGV14T_00393 [Phaeocystis globosa virus]
MSNYIPPNLWHNMNDTETDKKDIPSVDISNSAVGASFADITENGAAEVVYNYTDNIKPGWSVIKKNTAKNRSDDYECSFKTSNVLIFDSHQTKAFKEFREELKSRKEDANSLIRFDNMLNNWDKFRDIENDLQGDVSIYDNYKEDLAKMRLENQQIEERMEEYARMLELTDSESDDDERYR